MSPKSPALSSFVRKMEEIRAVDRPVFTSGAQPSPGAPNFEGPEGCRPDFPPGVRKSGTRCGTWGKKLKNLYFGKKYHCHAKKNLSATIRYDRSRFGNARHTERGDPALFPRSTDDTRETPFYQLRRGKHHTADATKDKR